MKMSERIKELLDSLTTNDPVYACDVYLDKAGGSCCYVDGADCDMKTCSMLKDYLMYKGEKDGI